MSEKADSSQQTVDRKKTRRFEDLTVWQKAHQLVLAIYKLTRDFPSEEKFALVSQMRRAAVSIPANIAEGFKKRGKKDKANFYNIAQGSLEELRYYIILSKDLGYLSIVNGRQNKGNRPNERHLSPEAIADEVGRMLHSLIKAVRAQQ